MGKIEKREEILRAALEVIAENGFHGAPVAMIAEQAKVGAGTIYRFFESKEVLIAAVHKDFQTRIYPVILEGYQEGKPLRIRFLHLFSALLRYFIRHPSDFRFVEQFRNSCYGVKYRRDKILNGDQDVFDELFEAGVAQQIMKALPIGVLYALSIGPLLTVARDAILGFLDVDDGLLELTVAASWDAVKL